MCVCVCLAGEQKQIPIVFEDFWKDLYAFGREQKRESQQSSRIFGRNLKGWRQKIFDFTHSF